MQCAFNYIIDRYVHSPESRGPLMGHILLSAKTKNTVSLFHSWALRSQQIRDCGWTKGQLSRPSWQVWNLVAADGRNDGRNR